MLDPVELKKRVAQAIGMAIDQWIEVAEGCGTPCMKDDAIGCTQYEVFRDDPRYCQMLWEHLATAAIETITSEQAKP